MRNCIKKLLELCKKQPFDIDEIQRFIKKSKMNSEEITRAAIELCDYGMFSYSDYLYEFEKEPDPRELRTYDWERLFDLMLDNGLDGNLVICDDGRNFKNILQSLECIDDGELGARILRNVLLKGVSPNIIIDGIPFFEEIDGDLVTDIELDLYYHKWQLDKAVRFWLVLVGFGGVLKGGKLPVTMCDGRSLEIFREFEKFDYDIVYKKDDFELRIKEKETQRLVATL